MEEKSLDTLNFIITLLASVTTCVAATGSVIIWWISRMKKRKAASELLRSFFNSADLAEMTKNYVPSRYSEVKDLAEIEYDTESFRPKQGVYKNLVAGMVRRFTRPSKYKYYIILADSGIGKTTFMVNLFIALQSRILPFLFRPRPKTSFIHLGESQQTIEKILEITDKANTIILLDGLDEYNFKSPDHRSEIKLLLQHLRPFREIVITARIQFFSNTMEELLEIEDESMGKSGRHSICRFYLAPFTYIDVLRFLNNEFPLYRFWQWKLFFKSLRIVRKIPRLRMRPLLLSYIRVLIDSNKNYVYSADVFYDLVHSWVKWEAQKPISTAIYGIKSQDVLLDLSKRLARRLYETGKNTISEDDDLGKEIAEAFRASETTNETADSKDLNRRTRYRSLLTRSSDNQYRFSHKSIMEYLVAMQIFDPRDPLPATKGFENMDVAALFYYEMLHRHFVSAGVTCLFFYNEWKPAKDIDPLKLKDVVTINVPFPELINYYTLKFFPGLKQVVIFGTVQDDLLRDLYQTAAPEYDSLEVCLKRLTKTITDTYGDRYQAVVDILDIDRGIESVITGEIRPFNEPRPVYKAPAFSEASMKAALNRKITEKRQQREAAKDMRGWLDEHDAMIEEYHKEVARKKEEINLTVKEYEDEIEAWERRKISFVKNEKSRRRAESQRSIDKVQNENYERIKARIQPILPLMPLDGKVASFAVEQRRSMMEKRIDTLVAKVKNGEINLKKLNQFVLDMQKAQAELPGVEFCY